MINVSPFLDDEEKMYDFFRTSKRSFLAAYSYMTEEEYDSTLCYYRLTTKSQYFECVKRLHQGGAV